MIAWLKRRLWPGVHLGFGIYFAYAWGAHPDTLSWRVETWRLNNAREIMWWRFVLSLPARRLHDT